MGQFRTISKISVKRKRECVLLPEYLTPAQNFRATPKRQRAVLPSKFCNAVSILKKNYRDEISYIKGLFITYNIEVSAVNIFYMYYKNNINACFVIGLS